MGNFGYIYSKKYSAMRSIIKRNGAVVSLLDFQRETGRSGNAISRFFSINERSLSAPVWVLHELIFGILDDYRLRVGRPVLINSAYRSQAQQTALRERNINAAAISPHTWGLAVDIDTTTEKETRDGAAILFDIAEKRNVLIRVGFEQYLKAGDTFIHVDVCPEMFAHGKPWFFMNVPAIWRIKTSW